MLRFFLLLHLAALTLTQCPPGYQFYGGTNKCFAFVHDQSALKFWSDAQAACQQSGGNLASIDNEEENQYVANIFADFEDNSYFPWIGLTRPTPNATTPLMANWYWVDGSQSTYRKFSSDYSYQNSTVAVLEFDDVDWNALWNAPIFKQPYLCSAYPSFGNCTAKTHCHTGWTYFAESNSCFKTFFNQDFNGAEAVCKQQGGHLASIASDMENYVVGSLATTGVRQQETRQIWIGIQKVNGTWVNVDDGSEIQYYNFGDGFPDNFGGNENCVQMFADDWTQANGYQYTWNDLNCQLGLRAFVCKVKAM